MKKKLVVVLLSAAMCVAAFGGCGAKSDSSDSSSNKKTETSSKKEDQKAADAVAKKIDAIYVQERTDKTDEQCKAAKEAWDKIDRCAERTGRRRQCRSGLLRKRYRRCFPG